MNTLRGQPSPAFSVIPPAEYDDRMHVDHIGLISIRLKQAWEEDQPQEPPKPVRRRNSFIREPTKPTITEDEDEPVPVKRSSVFFLEPANNG